jgi:hypothetical protein
MRQFTWSIFAFSKVDDTATSYVLLAWGQGTFSDAANWTRDIPERMWSFHPTMRLLYHRIESNYNWSRDTLCESFGYRSQCTRVPWCYLREEIVHPNRGRHEQPCPGFSIDPNDVWHACRRIDDTPRELEADDCPHDQNTFHRVHKAGESTNWLETRRSFYSISMWVLVLRTTSQGSGW